MPLKEEHLRTGHFLFRWRSYLPLIMFVLILLILPYCKYPKNNNTLDLTWEIFCLLISLMGLSIRSITIGYAPRLTSGRNTRKQIAEVLNTTGMYSITRNPLYLGNFFVLLGISLFFKLWWFSLIVILSFWLYYERIIFAEEEFLRAKFKESYILWAEKTPVFLPKLKNWKDPETTFSFRKVLKSEYGSFYAIVTSYFIIGIITDAYLLRTLKLDTFWLIVFTASTVFYSIIRILKKMTNVLSDKRI